MSKEVTILLGGKQYIVKRKVYGQHMEWRKKLKATSVVQMFESLDGFVADLRAVIQSIPEGGGLKDIDVGQALGVARVLPAMVTGMLDSVDDIAELLFQYEPKLATERKWIEANAYDEEIVEAFMEVLKLLYPIMALWGMVSGSRAQQTHTNSPSQNGASGLPTSGPKKKVSTSSSTATSGAKDGKSESKQLQA